jgi:hypothetical protein
VLNGTVKHRERFRPFAPVVLQEYVNDWFDVPARQNASPFMLRVWPFLSGRSERVPAVSHVDGSARVQTIDRDTHPKLHALITAFYQRTGVPMLLNTSFNIAGEPIVERPEDALWSLLSTGLDYCVIEDRIVHRQRQFQTLLDLCPKFTGRTLAIGGANWGAKPSILFETEWRTNGRRGTLEPFEPAFLPTYMSSLRGVGDGCPVMSAMADTPWGEICVVLDSQEFELLRCCDGFSHLRTFVNRRPGWTGEWLINTVSRCYRSHLVMFVP